MFLFRLLLAALLLQAQAPDPTVLSQQAREAMSAGQFDRAAALYRQLCAQLPDVAGLRLNLGLALFSGGKYRDAKAELQKALKQDPAMQPAVMMLGLAHAKLGEPLAAIPLLERAHRAEPANPVVLLELADAYLSTGRYQPAADHFRKLTVLQPSNPTAWRGLGLSLTEHSQSLFPKLAPGSAEALTLLARAKLEQNEPKAAFSLVRQALERNPQFAGAHAMRADLYRRNGHPDWAATADAKARTLPPPGPGTYTEILRSSQEALEAFGKLAALPPSAELFETEAEAARARGANKEAVSSLRKALRLKPGNAKLERSLAVALFLDKDYERALPLLKKFGLAEETGGALLESGKAAEAIPYLEKVRTPAAQGALGRAYMETQQPAKAIAPLRAALAGDTDGSLHFQLARALQRTGATEQAQEMDRLSQTIRAKKAEQQEAAGAVVLTPP